MSQSSDLTDIKVAVGILQDQNVRIMKQQEAMAVKIDNFSFVKQKDFDEFKDDVKETYATKEELSPVKRVFYAVLVAACVGLVSLGYWIIQRLIQGGVR